MATRTYDYRAASSADVRGDGWLMFASLLLGLAGIWNILDGILALDNSKVFGPNTTYVFSDLRTWGWIILALGCIQIAASLTILSGSEWGRWFGIAVAGVNSIGQLAFIPVYPFWAITMFTVDLLIIYALAVYGGRTGEPV